MDPILENENQSTSEDTRSKHERGRHKHKKKHGQGSGGETVVGKRHKFLVTKLSTGEDKEEKPTPSKSYNSAHATVHFGTRGAELQRPHVRTIFDDKSATTSAESRASSVERDGACVTKEYETFHGTSTGQRSSIFDIFRLRRKSDSRKHGSIMQNVKAALGKTSSPTAQRSLEVPEIRKNGEKIDDKAVSDKRYYNTVTGAPSRKSSTITRVMDIFRSKPSESASPAEANKKSKSVKPTRRSSVGASSPTYHKTSYASLDPLQARQLFREVRGLPRYDPYLSILQISLGGRDKTRLLLNFFKYHKCHELMPKSAKVIIFDTQFLVRKTFPTLVSNGIRSAPLWDSSKRTFDGMITATDFIRILLILLNDKPGSMQELESHTLHTWKRLLRSNSRPLFSVGPDQSLHEAINILTEHRIHRLPIIDPYTGDVLYILSHKRILRFLFVYLNEFPELTFFHSQIKDLKIGTYNEMFTITEDNSVMEAFDIMLQHTVSALPVVDSNGKLIDIYAKCDVLNLVSEKLYLNLSIPIREVRQKKKDWQENLQKCHTSVTLYEALEIIVRTESHRLLMVDSSDRLVGIVSLSDLLVYLNRTIPTESKTTALQELFKPLKENKFVESAKETEPDTQSEDNTPGADTPASTNESADPTAESGEPTAKSAEPTAESAEPTAESAEPTAESAEPTAESDEPSAESAERTPESGEPIAESDEPTAESAEPTGRAETTGDPAYLAVSAQAAEPKEQAEYGTPNSNTNGPDGKSNDDCNISKDIVIGETSES